MSDVSGNCNLCTRRSAGRSGRAPRSSKNERLTVRQASTAVPLPPESREWQAFEEMFLASRAKFMGLAYGILQNKEDAEDAVQDALVSAYVHLRRFEGRSAIKTWFTRVVLNASLMIRRKRKPAPVEFTLETADADDPRGMDRIPATKPDPEMYCAETETLHLVDTLIGELPSNHASVEPKSISSKWPSARSSPSSAERGLYRFSIAKRISRTLEQRRLKCGLAKWPSEDNRGLTQMERPDSRCELPLSGRRLARTTRPVPAHPTFEFLS